MLAKDTGADDRVEDERLRELQVMLMLSVKAEIQLFCEGDGGLNRWLISKLKQNRSTDKLSSRIC